MSGWRYCKKGWPCDACRSESNKCRVSLTTNLRHCKVTHHSIPGLRYIRDDANGFGMLADESEFHPVNGKITSPPSHPTAAISNTSSNDDRITPSVSPAEYLAAHPASNDNIRSLAHKLRVSRQSLREMNIGCERDGYNRLVFLFPMYAIDGSIAALQRRRLNGDKWGPGGSGIFYPAVDQVKPHGPLIVIGEGGSDVAAGSTIGIYTVGRFNNTVGAPAIAELLRDAVREGAQIVVLAEHDRKGINHKNTPCDWPGVAGAIKVAAELSAAWDVDVSWTLPPEGVKDLRDWMHAVGKKLPAGTGIATKISEEITGELVGETARVRREVGLLWSRWFEACNGKPTESFEDYFGRLSEKDVCTVPYHALTPEADRVIHPILIPKNRVGDSVAESTSKHGTEQYRHPPLKSPPATLGSAATLDILALSERARICERGRPVFVVSQPQSADDMRPPQGAIVVTRCESYACGPCGDWLRGRWLRHLQERFLGDDPLWVAETSWDEVDSIIKTIKNRNRYTKNRSFINRVRIKRNDGSTLIVASNEFQSFRIVHPDDALELVASALQNLGPNEGDERLCSPKASKRWQLPNVKYSSGRYTTVATCDENDWPEVERECHDRGWNLEEIILESTMTPFVLIDTCASSQAMIAHQLSDLADTVRNAPRTIDD
jgi:hypothetical protein